MGAPRMWDDITDFGTKVGLLVGFSTWIGLTYYCATRIACIRSATCEAGDFVGFALISVGMVPAAGIAGLLAATLASTFR